MDRGGGSVNEKPTSSGRASYRVLLIEDHPKLGEVTAEMLRIKGLEVLLARTGQDGIAQAERASPDIVVCDLNLPDLAGREVARRLRSEGSRGMVLVGLSAWDPEIVRPEGEGAFDLYLSKPLDWDKLEWSLAGRLPRKKRSPTSEESRS
jgi:DNA-binding response OmpR family regulator